ncbi:DNA repair protein [Cytophagales bacterium WSM2-2]|nr:DNA repair protein [Cytophagales bacterium WSM2-2]
MEKGEQHKYEVAEIHLSYTSHVKASSRVKIMNSKDAYDVLLQNWDSNYIEFVEQFKVLLLNKASKVLGLFEVSSGGSTGTVADPRLIFAAAIKANACRIIIAHNHPSGSVKPSEADIALTKKLREGGRFLDIEILDHIILSKEAFYSFADEGIM